MSKSQSNGNTVKEFVKSNPVLIKEKSLEQRAFETLNRQIHQFDEPMRPARPSKRGYSGSGNKTRPPSFAVSFKLKSGKTIGGTCVCFDNPKMPKSKLFFPAGQKDGNGNSKKLCISSPVNARIQGGNIALIEDINDFLRDIHEQALCEFPEWLEKWGCRANENNPFLNLDEIREEWRFKKNQFEIFRLAAQAGFFTDSRPQNAERQEIVEIETNDLA